MLDVEGKGGSSASDCEVACGDVGQRNEPRDTLRPTVLAVGAWWRRRRAGAGNLQGSLGATTSSATARTIQHHPRHGPTDDSVEPGKMGYSYKYGVSGLSSTLAIVGACESQSQECRRIAAPRAPAN